MSHVVIELVLDSIVVSQVVVEYTDSIVSRVVVLEVELFTEVTQKVVELVEESTDVTQNVVDDVELSTKVSHVVVEYVLDFTVVSQVVVENTDSIVSHVVVE